jgi:hypothetical protein
VRRLAAHLSADVASPTASVGGQRAVYDALALMAPRVDTFELLGDPDDPALVDELLDRIAVQGGHEAALACREYRYAVEARMPGWGRRSPCT